MKKIIYIAPAKIHLMGEHSAVYGKPALLAAIDKSLTVTISDDTKKSETKTSFEFNNLDKFQEVIEEEIKKEYGVKTIPHYSIKIDSAIPVGYGLGSSAALSAAFTAALLSFLDIVFDNKALFRVAYKGEQFFHGNPSGGDLAVSIEGGLLYFRKEFEFLKNFSHLPFPISQNIKQFVIINSGKPDESTLEMVKNVGELKKESPEKINAIFEDQELQTKNLALSLKEGDEDLLINTMKSGEKNLEKLNVVSKTAKEIIQKIEELGGSAKIQGGGGIKNGSGMLLCYHPNPNILLNFARKLGLESEAITIEERGVIKKP